MCSVWYQLVAVHALVTDGIDERGINPLLLSTWTGDNPCSTEDARRLQDGRVRAPVCEADEDGACFAQGAVFGD